MSQEVKEKLTTKTLIWVAILTIFMACFWNFFEFLLPSLAQCTQRVNTLIPSNGFEFVGGPFVALLVVIVLQQIQTLRKYLTKTNLAYLITSMIAVSFYTHFACPTWNTQYWLSRAATEEAVAVYIPSYVMLPSSVSELLLEGTGNLSVLPWDILFPSIIWRFLLVVLFAGIGISITNIFRKDWIDVEQIPFPYASVAHSCMVNVENMKGREWTSKRPFLIGMLAGFILAVPLSGVALFPWFPDIYGWRANTCGPGSQQIAPSGIPWMLGIAKQAPIYALMLLVPLHALFSTLFYTLVFQIAISIAYTFGYYTSLPETGFCGRIWCFDISPFTSPPLYFATIQAGAALGLFVIVIVMGRRYIANTLRAAFGRSKGMAELEKEEPMSYRSSWIMLIAFYIMMMLFFMYTGISPWLSFVMPLSGIIIWIVATQIWGRLGFYWTLRTNFGPAVIRLLAWPTQYLPVINSTDYALVPLINNEWITHYAGGSVEGGGGWGAGFFVPSLSYKMANLTGVHPRNMLKVMVIAMFIAAFISLFNQVVLSALFGYNRTGGSSYGIYDLHSDMQNIWRFPMNAPLSEGATYLIIGFVFMVVGRYLYTKFLWIPDPMLALVAWSYSISLYGLWFPCLTAWIIKSIVLKIGSSKLYERWVVPFVGGFILGDTLEVLSAAIISYILFPPSPL